MSKVSKELIADGSKVLQMSEDMIATAGGKSVGQLLSKIEDLEIVLRRIKGLALARAEGLLENDSESVCGWAIGQGVSQRKITNESGLQDLLLSLLDNESGKGMLTREEIDTCSRLSLTKVEKLLKQKIHLRGKESAEFIRELIKPYVAKTEGKKKLVKVSTYTEIS